MKKHEEANNSFLSLGIIYAAGQMFMQAASFILLTVYTYYLSVDEFGKFSTVGTISDICGFLLVFGIYSGYNRFYKDYSDAKLKIRLKNTAFTFSVCAGVVMSLFILMLSGMMKKLVPGINNFFTIMIFMLINNLLNQISMVFSCDYFLEYKAKKIVIINLLKAIANMGFVVYFLAIKGQGIAGIYKGQMMAGLCLLFYFAAINRKTLRFEADGKMLKKMLKFGTGLIPCNLSSSVLNFSDRFFMAGYRSYVETGIYSVGYRFGMQIDPLYITPFNNIFTTYKYENWKDSRAHSKFNDMFQKYHIIGFFLILCIAVFSRIIIYIFTNNAYITAYRIVPVILVAYFLYGETRFYNLGTELKNKTWLDSVILVSGGLVNTLLNLLLIPSMGMEGAALATIISYLLINLMYIKISGRLYTVKYNYRNPLIIFVLTSMLYGIYYIYSVSVTVILYDIIPAVILPFIYIIVCLALGIIRTSDIKVLLKLLRKKHLTA